MEREEISKIREFAVKVKEDYSCASVYLFGSRAKGDSLVSSDYDVIIVSKSFKGIKFFSRPVKIYDYWPWKESLDVFCYTPEEFEEKKIQIGFVKEAMQSARAI